MKRIPDHYKTNGYQEESGYDYNYDYTGEVILVCVSKDNVKVWPRHDEWYGRIQDCPHFTV